MDSKKRIYLDIHILQTVPPSCVNRDDTGSPKTARYGGVTRARVSSQAWKRAVRLMFRDMFSKDEVGIRTKRVVELVKEHITALKPDAEKPEKLAAEALDNAGVKLSKDKTGTDALFFISAAQASALAKLAVAGEKATKKKATKKNGNNENPYQKALKDDPSVDIALFGRMVASDPSLNYDAAAQVAHAISTHEVRNEFDYFTAMDDLAPEDNAGAAHLDTTEFNSCTMYRYATAGIHELAGHLGAEEAVRAAVNFVRAFCLSMPTGKQNSFANRTAPEAAYVAIRKDQPVNLAGAFERPVRSFAGGYEEPSEEALAAYAQKTYGTFVEAPKAAFVVGGGEKLDELGRRVSLEGLVKELEAVLGEMLKENAGD
ncbi:MAG TPA: type I-E CRISPR-associated protein Cas7/Cse4/CasC [Candidatus Caccocola faecigallinarum]|nr:type I-E CRISPR-associated protein Cas7/Cse4/CasC [Candidatus Caccocola faecigallinarum]